MSIKRKENITSTEYLLGVVKICVETRLKRLVGTINQALSSLFFEIGIELNYQAQNLHFPDKKSTLIQEVSNNLQPIFGNHLSSQNLFLMAKFADKCSSEKKKIVAATINWNYVPHFLNLPEDDEWEFYSDLIYNKSLTPIELSKEISDKAFEIIEKKINTDKYAFMSNKAHIFYQNTLELYFSKKSNSTFSKLFTPENKHIDYLSSLTLKEATYIDIVTRIYNKIINFQSIYNHQLNLEFNILIWGLGVEIIKLSKSNKALTLDNLLDQSTMKFQHDFPSIFNHKELSYCINFVSEYGERNNPPIELMQLVPWAYLRILVKIEGHENRLFVANEILKKNLSLQEVEKIISDGYINYDMAKKQWQRITSNNPIKEITTKELNFITTGTIETIEPIINAKNDLNRNIYKNPDLIALLTHNPYIQNFPPR